MRPIRLKISALGPYVEPLALDFRALGENRLFLLNGPTGSGKTMLLDAMCFALFGETTGEQRSPKSLRSQHAPANVPTEVTLDFALGERQYRVWRRPEQDRPRHRGTGMMTEAAKATLWDRTGAADDSVEGSVLAARPAEVNESVIEILGFRADQFRSVAVLPQGEFQRFLNAPSEEREKILEVLFQTTVYRRLQDAVAARAQEAERAVRAVQVRLAGVFEQANVGDEAELQARIDELAAKSLAAGERVVELRASREAASGALDAARDADRRIRELRLSEADYDRVFARAGEFQAKEAEIRDARRAAPIAPLARERDQRAEEAARAQTEAAGAAASLERAEVAAVRAEEALKAAEAREPERVEARRKEHEVQGLVEKAGQLAAASRQRVETAAALSKTEMEQARAREQFEACAQLIGEAEQEYEVAMRAAEPLDRVRAEQTELDRIASKREQLARARSRHSKAELAERAALGLLKSAEQRFADKREALETLENRWLEGQAAVLAASLAHGAACPVCGSTEHPAPATAASALPSERDRKRAREGALEAESAVEAARNAAARAAVETAGAAAQVQGLEGDLGQWLKVDDAGFAIRRMGIGERLAAAEAAKAKAEAIKRRLDKARGEVPGLTQRREMAEAACREAASRAEAARAVEGERARAVPPEYRGAGAIEQALAAASDLVRKLEDELRKAREEAEKAGVRLSSARANLEQWNGRVAEARVAAETAAARLKTALLDAGFEREGAFRLALRDASQLAALDTETQRFRSELNAAEARLARAREAAEGVIAPDLAAAEIALERCQKELEDGLLYADRLKRDALQCGRWLEEARQISADIEQAEGRLRILSTLSQTANGRNGRRITLQRFVQVTLLERILAAATHRLQLMSSGRYWLRVAQETLDRRVAAGLDLEVFDAHTGQARRVSTLSGGESFLASLSLALGLSDTVQSYAGGCHLESVFIDEGFGTLDPEALELAMSTLRDLQQGGRLVGIISHVPELRQQIDVRLDVIRLKRGSTARFVAPGTGSLSEPAGAAN